MRARTTSAPPLFGRGPGVPATFDDSPMASIDRARPPKPTPPPPAPVVARTRSSTASPLAVSRARDVGAPEPLPRHRAPQSSSTCIEQVFDSDFGEDTVPEAQALTALTDQDDRGVRRS